MNDIERWLKESARLKIEVAETLSGQIEEAARRLAQAMREGNKLYLIGNGGSAADAQHIAGEFINRFLLDRGPLPAIALTTDTSVLTAVSNDYGFGEIFAKQVAALVKEGDVVWALSTSGTSPNIVMAMRLAREMGAVTFGLTGKSGGDMSKFCDYCICIPSSMTPHIQEAHITIAHAICDIVERMIFEGSHRIGG